MILQPNQSKFILLLYCIPLFLIGIVETGMAFVFPLFVVKSGISNTELGIILGIGALTGMCCNIFLPRIKKLNNWKIQFLMSHYIALLFPLLSLLAFNNKNVFLFILASIFWYVFYELLLINQQQFLVNVRNQKNYTKEWAILYFVYASASIIGPIVGSFYFFNLHVLTSIFMILIGIGIIFLFLLFAFTGNKDNKHANATNRLDHISLYDQIKIYSRFITYCYPVFILGFVLLFIDEMFWHFGSLLGESIHIQTEFNWIIIVSFSLPVLFGSMIVSGINIKVNKLKTALLFTAAAGLFLLLTYFTKNNVLLIFYFFVNGIATSIAMPFYSSFQSDLLKKMNKYRNYFLSLVRIFSSLSYLLSPVLVGLLSDRLGYKESFVFIGIVVIGVSLLFYVFNRNKQLLFNENMMNT